MQCKNFTLNAGGVMAFKFNDTHLSRESRYTLGSEEYSGKLFLSFPVSNRMVDYEEYYELTIVEYKLFLADTNAAKVFLLRCYKHLEDERMTFYPPAPIRGSPI
jgi:hypothetical protein